MFIFYDIDGQVYKLHLNNDDASVGLLFLLEHGIQLNNHGIDHDFLRDRQPAGFVLKHEPECRSAIGLDLDYVVRHLSSLRFGRKFKYLLRVNRITCRRK